MSLYPSLEDMKVDQMAQAQHAYQQSAVATAHAIAYPDGAPPQPAANAGQPTAPSMNLGLYPSLDEYMGLTLNSMAAAEGALVPSQGQQVAVPSSQSSNMVAPITGSNNVGVRRAEIKQGIREVILCKDQDGKVGLRVKSVNKGLFVAFVHRSSPSALAGLRFGDQILQINGQDVAGWDTDKGMKFLSKCDPQRITLAIRDRPFERTISMQKDSAGTVGFVFKDGKITALVKDTSAARNGVLIDHQLVEVNGQNVVGIKDKEIAGIIEQSGRTVTITVLPSMIYEHIVKSIGSSLIKKFMDHSVPDV